MLKVDINHYHTTTRKGKQVDIYFILIDFPNKKTTDIFLIYSALVHFKCPKLSGLVVKSLMEPWDTVGDNQSVITLPGDNTFQPIRMQSLVT